MTPRCPKCRALGLATDCSERIIHDRKQQMNGDDADEGYELQVGLNFFTPVSSRLDLEPQDMAIHMRDIWVNDPDELKKLVSEAADIGDYEVTVSPAFYD